MNFPVKIMEKLKYLNNIQIKTIFLRQKTWEQVHYSSNKYLTCIIDCNILYHNKLCAPVYFEI